MPETAKKKNQKIPTVNQNSSNFAKIGPCWPARLDEIWRHASLHFVCQIFQIVLSIANRAHLGLFCHGSSKSLFQNVAYKSG